MKEEVTEKTVIAKPKRGPSFWYNTIALVAVFGVIFAAHRVVTRWIFPSQEEPLSDIVLEDLENQKPLAESQPVTVIEVKETPPPPPIVEEKKVAPKPKVVRKKKVAKKKQQPWVSPYANDPYTDGGPGDIDRPENKPTYFPEGAKEATAEPLKLRERDEFIPFEKD